MPRFRSLSMAALAVLPALPLTLPVSHPPAAVNRHAGLTNPTWDLALSRHFGHPWDASGFSTIVLTGGQLWAFGGTNPGGASAPVAERLTGKRWAASALPGGLTDFISDASAPSRQDIWAVSGYGRYVLRWDGSRWRVMRTWREPGYFSGLVATSPRDAWAFGTAANGDRSLGTWHFDGKSWRRVPGAASGIYRASAVTSQDIWAIAAGSRGDAILHFGGRQWYRVPASRAISRIRWRDILAESVRNVWLLGDTAKGRLVLAHWNGEHWRWHVTSIPALAGRLAGAGRGRVLATATSSVLLPAGLIVVMTRAGHLTSSAIASSLGCGVSDAAFASGTGVVWASGGTLTRLGGDAAIWVRTPPAMSRRADSDDVR